MTHPNPRDERNYQEEALAEDPAVTKEAATKNFLRVEGQNEVIKTPPKPIEEEIAATAQDIDDLTMGVEDET